ncbi:MAG: valine--tRNA ligase [Candidatus Omnitrophica bacterium]|nr:valine--tRNA ligase [Candidatus Omnitrophota bacterium]MDD5429273.1 valine--tRNA ligase [Candidatus Omnitrophota bacterium]
MEIASRYNPQEIEPRILNAWLQGGHFHSVSRPGHKPFSIVIPPPNVTGILHMGHALNNTIQDVLIRFNRMRAKDSLWMPGTDHAGIATQNVVEKALAKEGLRKEDLGREEFTRRLWDWKEQHGSVIINQLKRLGASCDWQRTRFTMDEAYSKAVTKVFVSLWNKNLIYRGYYIINWCPRCKTALSDEEAPYQQAQGYLYYIKYPLVSQAANRTLKPGTVQATQTKYIVVATTRPETMLGDVAVAVNPEDKRFASYIGKKLLLPIMQREIPVLSDSFVDPDFGTGAVKITPAHDLNDFEMANRHNLSPIVVMNPDATMNENAGEYKGMDRFKARGKIVEFLKNQDLILKVEPYTNAVSRCYRCDTVVEPYLSRQWFVRMEPLAKPAIKAVRAGKIKFNPKRWEKVYLNWMENIRDWCISRQIWWGHRLPVYYCKKCKEEPGRNNKSQITNDNFHPKGVIVAEERPQKCPHCGSQDIVQDSDVLDTWFSSWLWPFATFGWPFDKSQVSAKPPRRGQSHKSQDISRKREELKYFYPTNVLITAPEIIFFWVARMIMAGFEFMGKEPFRDVCIHGTVRDNSGRKMSKSLGNVIDPLDIIDKVGADALRFSLILLAASGSDVYLSEDKFLVGRNFSNKIWNATRFVFLKIEEKGIKVEDFKFSELDEVDEWILRELSLAVECVTESLETYSLNEAAKKIYEFFWHSFCDWYIEIVKDNFTLSKAKAAVFVLLESIKLLHPFMPFISEEVFNLIKKHTSLPLSGMLASLDWPKIGKHACGKPMGIELIFDTIKEVRNIKADLGLGQKKVDIEVDCSPEALKLWNSNQGWIERLALLKSVVYRKGLNRVLYKNKFWALNIVMDNVSLDNFLISLGKKVVNLEAVLSETKARLENKGFIQNASSDIIDREKAKLRDTSLLLQRLLKLKGAFE